MDRPRICRACTRQLLRRFYTTHSNTRDYKGAIAALNTLQTNYATIKALQKEDPGWNQIAIPKMTRWAERIGYKPKDFDHFNPIHIAGTKGKGSTSTFISSILAQYLPTKHSIHAERLPSSVGLYTSPHLRFVRERIQIDNKPISEELFAKYFWELWDRFEATRLVPDLPQPRSVALGGKPVYFHFLTLMTFHCFLQEKVGTAVIECGIGGEYDTTNILLHPSVTGITSLGIDHQNMLGDTLESIAWHKAGILKPNVPAYSVPQPENAARILLQRAEERNTTLHFVPTHPALEDENENDGIKLGLQGAFQKLNASLAIAISAQHLHRLGYNNIPNPLSSDPLPAEFITGLESARLGGRCETRRDPHLSNLTWYLDGAHTLESIEGAATWFARSTSHPSPPPSNARTQKLLILNQQTRDANSLARQLFSTLSTAMSSTRPFGHVIFCPNRTSKDAGYKPDLVSLNTDEREVRDLSVQTALAATWAGIDSAAVVDVVDSIESAVARAREIGGEQATEVLVTGSLHLVGGLIDVLESEMEKQMR